jgi:nucleotide-binding universal stress UspA family protein
MGARAARAVGALAEKVEILCVSPSMDRSSGSPRATLQAGDGHESFRAAWDIAKALGTMRRWGADLLVIGVYGHPRMLQIVLDECGMVSEAELPILLSY